MKQDSKFGIGFPSLCCGGQWSAFAVTKAMIEKVGLCDENIFPVFYEDNDYGVRIHLSNFKAKKFKYIPMIHGQHNGYKKYVSGTIQSIKAMGDSDEVKKWNSSIYRGRESSENYLVEKWGFEGEPQYFGCKTVDQINSVCQFEYRHPFNDSAKNISYWDFDSPRREWILSGQDPKPFRTFSFNQSHSVAVEIV